MIRTPAGQPRTRPAKGNRNSRWAVAVAATFACCVFGVEARGQLTTGLQSYFNFETGTISNAVSGTSGYTPAITNTGTPQSGFTGSGSRPLLAGNSLNLIRSENDFFSISNIGSGALTPVGGLNLGGTFTLSAWHYLDPAAGSPTTNRYYVWEGVADHDVSYGTGGGTSGPDNYTAYATTVTGQTVSLQRNTWNNIVQVFSNDGTNITGNLYINGQFIGSNTTLLSNMNWAGLRYGNSRGATPDRAWDGTLDEIGIWNTSLTGAQAQEVYIRGLQGTGLTAATTGVGSWSSSAATNSWTAGGNWTAGTAIGAVGASAGSSNAVAIFGGYSLATGLGIDMSAGAADGALGLGALVLDSGSGSLRIGNSSADTNGMLRLNGATTGAGANTLLSVAGASDLVIANSPDAATPGTTTLGVTLGIANGTISIGTGRTATIESVIGEATAGSGFTKTGTGTLVLAGSNAYTGTTAISAGTLSIASTAFLPGWDTAGRFSVGNGATLAVGNAVIDGDVTTLVGTGNFAAGSLLGFDTSSGDRSITGPVAGVDGLGKLGSNTLTLAASNSYTGPTAISGGTLAVSGQATIEASSGVMLTATGTGFDISAADGSRTIAGLTGAAGSSVTLGANSLTVGAAAATTFAGGIGGTGGLIKAGTAALTLSGSSTYSGGTTIRAGSIVATAGSATLGTGGVTLNDSQTGSAATGVTVNADLAYGIPLTVANEGSGASTITLSGAVTSGSRTPFTSIQLDRAATLDFQTTGEYAFNSPLLGSGPLTIAGNNTYKLAGGSWAGYTGPVTIASGAAIDLRNRLGAAANTNQLTVNGTMWVVSEETIGPLAGSGSVTTNTTYGSGTRSIIIGAGDGAGTFSGVIGQASGAAPLRITKNGTGTQTLSGANTFTGGSTINAGTLALSGAGTLGGTTSPVALSGGRLALGGTSQTTGALTVSAAAATGDTITAGTLTSASYAVSNASGNVSLAASLAGIGRLTKTGAGTLTLGAASTFSGGAALNAGTVAANAASAMGTGTTTVASAATLEIGHVNALQGSTLSPATGATVSFNAGAGTTYAIGGLSGAGNLVATGNTLAIGANNASTTYSGVLTADALTKQGTGSLTLSNTGHTLGGVTVAGGTLVAVNAAGLGAGAVTLAGGRLQYAGETAFTNGIVLSGAAAGNAIDLALPVDYLVVGGGGGGAGRDVGGGGGGGGVLSNLIGRGDSVVATSAIGVTVGGGGNGGVNEQTGFVGGNSAFGTIVAIGGGGGSSYRGTPTSGGSGGGGGREGTAVTGGAGTAGPPRQGFNGGNGSNGAVTLTDSGGGGGGAGAVGGNAIKDVGGGSGGAGVAVPILLPAEATALGIGQVSGGQVFFGGGGGGAPHRTATLTSGGGGVGGGGAAAPNATSLPAAGQSNTGGGGGAARSATAGSLLTGGAGGSGVVVVRYLGAPAATGGTITAGIGDSAGYTIHTFTTAGTSNFTPSPTRTVSGDVTGSGGFTFNTPAATLVLEGTANTYSGGTVVSGGTLRGASAAAFGTGIATASGGTLEVAHVNALRDATLNAAGGTVAFTAAGTNTYGVAGLSGAGGINAGANALAVGGGNASSSFAGSLTAAALVKQGSGTLTLSGSNTLADTRIEAGSVFAKSGTAFGAGTVTLAGGGLRVAPGTAISNAIILDGAAGSNVLGSAVELDYLVAGGGGGGGGRDASGGGGAGGVLSNLVSAGLTPILGQVGDTFAVTVGGGGAGGGVSSGGGAVGQGTNGNPSSFATVTALGGGGGGAYNSGGKNGASGGGAGRGPASGGTGTAGQGLAGGNGIGSTNNDTGAGGGGAGAVGGNGTSSAAAGSGGAGLAVPIVPTTLATTLSIGQVSGPDVMFGGGGGGTPHRNATTLASGSGGLGGGGAGSVNNSSTFPTPGTANTGGGGGASRTDDASRGIGGAGGSGVVVVRYAGDQAFSGGDDVRTEGGFTYHTFKTIGSSSLNYLGGDATVSSAIGGTGGFTWSSAGTLTLSGSNSFQGGTIISAGTLVAATASALGTGTATVASGARLRLDPGSVIANPIANLGTGSFLGAVDFAGGGLARTSTAGGTTFGTLLAGSSGATASLNPAISWLGQTGATASDIMRLTNTSGTAQVLSLTYDPVLAPAAPQEAYLGWFDPGTTDWVNAIDGNVGGTGSFFNGSWTAYLAANPTATPSTTLGVYGHDTATNSVWAVVNHNSDFAVIVVPEPGTLALAGLGLAGLGLAALRRHHVRRRCSREVQP